MKELLLIILNLNILTNVSLSQCTPSFTDGPDDVHILPVSGQCTGTVSYSAPTFTGCPDGVLWQTAGLPSGSVFPQGTTTNTFVLMEKLVLLEEDFSDNSAGWTLGTEWQIGPATTSTCGLSWAQDPGTDNTPTADNGIAGVVIGGCAAPGIHSYYYITSPVINTSGSNYLGLDLYRWLDSDYAPWMQNRIEIWDGAAWQVIWQTGGSPVTNDNAWTLMSFDIQAYSNAALQIRIGFNIGSAGVYPVGSWNLDDIKIYDLTPSGATYSFDVNVSNQTPVIICPGNMSVSNSTGLACSEPVNYQASVTSCVPQTTAATAGLPSGAEFPIGTTTVELISLQDSASYTLFFKDNFMDNSAGWTLDTEWEIGSALTSTCGGNPDPGADHTNTADNGVAGVILGGCASTAIHGYYYLTSPVIDVSGATSLTLDFWRWLNSDLAPNMQNIIEVYDGLSWQLVWQSGATAISDTSWAHEVFDLTAYINNNLQVRFGHQVGNAGGSSLGSWNIDDFVIYGNKAFSASCTFDVTVGPSENTETTNICQGDTLVFGTQMITTGGTYTETWIGGGSGGCDSTVVLTITENPVYNINTTTQICAGDSLVFGSQLLNTAGVYTELFASTVTGCDSTVVLTLDVAPIYNDTMIQTICFGDSTFFGGAYYSTAGSYVNNAMSVAGCDSSTLLFLSISIPTEDTFSVIICGGDTYMLGTQGLSTPGVYTGLLSNMYGCDSTVTIDLTVDATPVINVNGVTEEINGNDGAIDVQILSANPFSVSWSNGATTDDLSGIPGGVYIITVTDNSTGCQDIDTVVVSSQAGVDEQVQNKVKLFPNPNDGHFEVSAGKYRIDRIIIIDYLGRLVGSYAGINQATYQFDLDELEPGMYQLIIETKHGTIVRNVIIL